MIQKVNINSSLLFTLFCLSNGLLTFLVNTFIITDDVILNSFIGVNGGSWVALQRKFQLIGYLLIPFVFLKFLILRQLLVWINQAYDLKADKKYFMSIIIVSEFTYLLFPVITFVCFLLKDFYTLEEVENFIPLSVLSLFFEREKLGLIERFMYSFLFMKFSLIEVLYVFLYYAQFRKRFSDNAASRLFLFSYVPYLVFTCGVAVAVLLILL